MELNGALGSRWQLGHLARTPARCNVAPVTRAVTEVAVVTAEARNDLVRSCAGRARSILGIQQFEHVHHLLRFVARFTGLMIVVGYTPTSILHRQRPTERNGRGSVSGGLTLLMSFDRATALLLRPLYLFRASARRHIATVAWTVTRTLWLRIGVTLEQLVLPIQQLKHVVTLLGSLDIGKQETMRTVPSVGRSRHPVNNRAIG